MRSLTIALLALALAFIASSAAAAQTDREKFEKALEKHALLGNSITSKVPKNLCRCLHGIVTAAPAAGWVTIDQLPSDPNRVTLRCAIPVYEINGAIAGVNYCIEREPL